MAKTLHISDDLKLPLDYATKTAAILAQRRKGKTYTASVIAEEMVAVKQPFVALDPTGAWWGLRASADGSAAGLPVVILGGQHGDVPLERTAGRLIADLVVDSPGYYVIDFSLFESGEAERQFAVDFAERLYRAKAQPGKNFPLHLFVDEADRFIPQSLTNKSETSPRLLGAFEAIVRRGGLRGLGTTLISQRAAVVNKNVLEMLDILIALRTIGPNDQKAVKGYVQAHGSEKELADIMGSLASLAIGEAWFWEPGADLIKRVQIRQRLTFNSSATPDTAERAVEPKQLAKVDLEALTQRMAETIERAKADDPKELRRQLADAKRELQKKSVESLPTGIKPPTEILTDADRELVKSLREEFLVFSENIVAKADVMLDSLAVRAKASIDDALKVWTADVDRRRELFAKRLESARVQKVFEKVLQLQAPTTERFAANRPSVARKPESSIPKFSAPTNQARNVQSPATGPSGALSTGQQAILDTLAMLEVRGIARSIDSLTAWLDLHPNGGTFRGNLRVLRNDGFLDDFELTDTGRNAARALATGIDAVKQRLTSGELNVFEAIEEQTKAIAVEQLGEFMGLHPNGGTFRGNIRRLVRMGVITGGQMRVTDGARR